MADLIGKDFTPPDLEAKVTGRAKYAEDFRAEGMLFCRLITSPMPHARVRGIDPSEALAMEGVVAILTADDVPEIEAPGNPILTNTPHFVGEPIAALARLRRRLRGMPSRRSSSTCNPCLSSSIRSRVSDREGRTPGPRGTHRSGARASSK